MSVKQEHIDLYKKIEAGLKLAYHKLYLQKAANNETVVVSINGEIKHVPARELLKEQEKH
jgi:hypothetical protein